MGRWHLVRSRKARKRLTTPGWFVALTVFLSSLVRISISLSCSSVRYVNMPAHAPGDPETRARMWIEAYIWASSVVSRPDVDWKEGRRFVRSVRCRGDSGESRATGHAILAHKDAILVGGNCSHQGTHSGASSPWRQVLLQTHYCSSWRG